jgi:hypothetical protein
MKPIGELKQHSRQAFFFFLLSAVMVGGGSWIKYHYNYKDGFWMEMLHEVPIILGWVFMLYPLVILHIHIKNGKKQVSLVRKAGHGLFFMVYLIWLVALIAGLVELEMLAEKRVDTILASPETHFAKARVTHMEIRRRKSSTRHFAMIEYEANGKIIEQSIRDEEGFYQPGQVIDIKYADKYPDMFRVVLRFDQ